MRTIFRPDESQEAGIKHLLKLAFAGLFWPPGLGKTAVVLFAFWCLRKRKMARRMLVISKVKVVTNTWPREIEKWDFCEGITYAVAKGGKRLEALDEKADIVLLNMENTEWFVDLVMGRREKIRKGNRKVWITHPPERPDLLNFDVLCVDESSKYRNRSTRRFAALERILPSFKRRYILTGSPAPKGLMNLWAQMYIVDLGEALEEFITRFRTKYFYPVGKKQWNQWVIKDGSEKKIYKAISKRILRIGDGALKMPPLPPPVNRMVYLEPDTRKIYQQMERESLLELEGEKITAANGGVKTSKLRQIANGRVYVSPSDDDLKRSKKEKRKSVRIHDEKAMEVLNLIEEVQGTPALIGYEHHSDLEALLEVLGRDSPVIGGGTSDESDNELIDRWNAGELPYLLCQYDVVSHGLNMQDTHAIVVYYGIPWDLEVYEQFYRRIWRRGQKKTVMRYHILVENSVDDQVCLPGIQAKDNRQQRLLRELEKFMSRRKKFTRPTSFVHLNNEAGMQLIKDTMKSVNQEIPKLRENVKDPGGVLLSLIHKRAKEWTLETRQRFAGIANRHAQGEEYDGPVDTQTILKMIDEIMYADVENPITPDSYRKWNKTYSKELTREIGGAEVATSKATKKQKTKGKKSAKKDSAEKASANKTSKKSAKTSTKKASANGAYVVPEDAKEPRHALRQKIAKKVAEAKGRGVSHAALVEYCEKTLKISAKKAELHIAGSVDKGFIAAK